MNFDFRLNDMISSRVDKNKDIILCNELITEDSTAKQGSIITNNFLIKNTTWSHIFLNTLMQLGKSKNVSVSNAIQHICSIEKMSGHVQIINNQHLFNSICSSNINGWVIGDFLMCANYKSTSNKVKDFFHILSSIINTNTQLVSPFYNIILKIDEKTSLRLNRYLDFVEITDSISTSYDQNPRKGEWYTVSHDTVGLLFDNEKIWTYVKIKV